MFRQAKKKKNIPLMVLITSLLIIGIIMVFFISFHYGTSLSDQQGIQMPNDNGHPKAALAPAVPVQEKPKSWTHAIGDTYIIDFPSTWTVYSSDLMEGPVDKIGEKVVYTPVQLVITETSPTFEIDRIPVYPKMQTIQQRIATLAQNNYKFTQSTTEFHGAPAISLHSSSNNVDKTIILLTNKDDLYVITLQYYLDKNASINKGILDTMSEKFQFK